MSNAFEKTVVVDNINLFSTLKILRWSKQIDVVELLDDPQQGHLFFQIILRLFKIKVEILDFKFSQLKSTTEESIWVKSLKDSTPLAYSGSLKIAEEFEKINGLRNSDVIEAIRLASAKFLDAELRPLVKRVLVLNKIQSRRQTTLMLKRPAITDDLIAYSRNMNIELKFYQHRSATFLFFLKQIYLTFGQLVLYRLNKFKKKTKGAFVDMEVISFHEETIGLDFSYRVQPHWLENVRSEKEIQVGLLRKDSQTAPSQSFYSRLKDLGVHDVAFSSIHDPTFSQVRTSGTKILESALSAIFWKWVSKPRGYNLNHIMHLYSVVWIAIRLARLCSKLNVKAYVFAESYNLTCDSMVLACRLSGVKSIAYQYSLLYRPSLSMMSLADYQLVFSERAKLSLSFGVIGPREFIVASYPYERNLSKVNQRAALQKKVLKERGVDLVIGYFDENINRLPERWDFLGLQHHKEEITALANLVLTFQDLAVILKPQFLYNSSKILYKDDKIIRSAFATGRFIEKTHGTDIRNIVFPGEVGQICDICIGNKLGATACLESVLQGCKAILINPMGGESIWDCYFDSKNISFNTLGEAISACIEQRRNFKNSDLGDWSNFVDEVSKSNNATLSNVIISKALNNSS